MMDLRLESLMLQILRKKWLVDALRRLQFHLAGFYKWKRWNPKNYLIEWKKLKNEVIEFCVLGTGK